MAHFNSCLSKNENFSSTFCSDCTLLFINVSKAKNELLEFAEDDEEEFDAEGVFR